MRARKRSVEREGRNGHFNYPNITSKAVRDAARRRRKLAIAFAICSPCLFLYFLLCHWRFLWVVCAKIRYGFDANIPPSFEEFYEIERRYPQHNASLPFPEGKDGRYLWVSNPHWGLGWNNVFQVLYMTSHLAYLSNRAHVFKPYTWKEGPLRPFTEYNGHLTSSRIPLSAFVDGPIAGGPFPPNKPNPRAVNYEYFKRICPDHRRKKISILEMNQGLQGRPVIEILEKYTNTLKSLNDSCVELYGGNDHVFDWPQFGHPSMETVWPSLSQSPIMTEFSWAPHILEAVRKNTGNFVPELTAEVLPEVVPDLMAIHIRRGDYIQHCYHLANWSAEYMGWSQSPGLPDRFIVPPGGGAGYNTPQNTKIYLDHCYPEIDRILERVREVRKEWESPVGGSGLDVESSVRRLRKLFIMTNGDRNWVASLKERLQEEGEWDAILSSRDLTLTPEQKAVAQTVDMAIAQRSAVFLGNGPNWKCDLIA